MTWIALLGVVASQGASPIVNLDRLVAPTGEVVKTLGTQYGESWAAEGPVAHDVLFISSHGKSAAQVRAAIAGALHGEWKEQSTGWVLSRKPATENQLAAEAVANRVAWLRAEIAARAAEAKKLPEFTAERAKEINDKLSEPILNNDFSRHETLQGQLPAARHIPQIVEMLDMNLLGAMAPDERIVFASRPTQMQKQLPSAVQGLAFAFAKDQAILDAASGGQTNIVSGGGSFSFSTRLSEPGGQAPEPPGPPAFAHVAVQLRNGMKTYSVSVSVFDANGKQIASGEESIVLAYVNRPNQTADFDGSATISLGKLEQEILALENARIAQAGNSGMLSGFAIAVSGSDGPSMISSRDRIGVGRPEISKELRTALLNPTKYDPATFFFGDAAQALGKERQMDIVAVLPDRTASQMMTVLRRNQNTGNFLKELQSQLEMQVSKGGGWMTITPLDWSSMWQERVNRVGLERLIQLLDQNGTVSLDQLAEFAKFAPENSPRDFGGMREFVGSYAQMIEPSAMETSLEDLFENRRALKFYAMLPVQTRSALMAGEEINVAGLDASIRALLHRMVYWSWQGPMPGNRGLDQSGRLSGLRMLDADSQSAQSERTVFMPQGIAKDSKVRFQYKTDLSAEVKGSSGSTAVYSAQILAMDQLRRSGELPEIFGQMNQGDVPVPIEGFRDASQSKISMQFAFGTAGSMTESLNDRRTGSGAFGPYEGLSKLLRDEVDKQAAQIRTAFSNVRLGGGGNAKP